ncbi:UpxY family transcription antiterminator [Flammeovirga sp. EKP202]|uniref:UpxY family transcription antiterminator n=1 Tax=Flammeovirga sp. EKP202 TaxID=2770592 RepID=UPI00165EC087|nr:UpxY family transcription antiterminator [Flammeovirga sp. EKP202]MBD0404474.1 UpxY family transcription antiterminator [Flammeovirga sp. EKP202]
MTIKESRQWLVVYTKPKSEKKVTERLNRKGFSTYCPTYTSIKQWRDRKKKVSVPVIPSYIFIQLNEFERWEVLTDPGIVNFIYWQGKPAVIQESQLNAFKDLINNTHDPSLIKIENLNEGDRVILKDHRFDKQCGTIQSIHKGNIKIILAELNLKIICNQSKVLVL